MPWHHVMLQERKRKEYIWMSLTYPVTKPRIFLDLVISVRMVPMSYGIWPQFITSTVKSLSSLWISLFATKAFFFFSFFFLSTFGFFNSGHICYCTCSQDGLSSPWQKGRHFSKHWNSMHEGMQVTVCERPLMYMKTGTCMCKLSMYCTCVLPPRQTVKQVWGLFLLCESKAQYC